ncbi:MAG: hypothetical protein C4B57_12215 [Deltaproteobacteria bacterium]|nr:MAG: hypothetical protein C4B57_12215 [Deltaproteobacteria bacterium]
MAWDVKRVGAGKRGSKAMFFFNKVKKEMGNMKAELIMHMIGALYGAGLRDLLIQAIDDPEKVWDDAVVRALDALLGYDGGEEG